MRAHARAAKKGGVEAEPGGFGEGSEGDDGLEGVFMKRYAAGTFLFYWVNPGFSL